MRAVVFSDSHGNFSAMEQIVSKHLNDTALFIFLGDGLRDTEDIISVYPQINLRAVCGNCDFFPTAPDYDEVTFGGKRIFFTHGHIFGVKDSFFRAISRAKSINADILLLGHTHTPYNSYENGLYVMNPGSLRSGAFGKQTYGIIDISPSGVLTNIVEI